jgi:hypothetical protein
MKEEEQGHTDGTDDGSLAIILRGSHVWVQLGVPLQLHTVAKMVGNGNGHSDEFSRDEGKKKSVRNKSRKDSVEDRSVDEDHRMAGREGKTRTGFVQRRGEKVRRISKSSKQL